MVNITYIIGITGMIGMIRMAVDQKISAEYTLYKKLSIYFSYPMKIAFCQVKTAYKFKQ